MTGEVSYRKSDRTDVDDIVLLNIHEGNELVYWCWLK